MPERHQVLRTRVVRAAFYALLTSVATLIIAHAIVQSIFNAIASSELQLSKMGSGSYFTTCRQWELYYKEKCVLSGTFPQTSCFYEGRTAYVDWDVVWSTLRTPCSHNGSFCRLRSGGFAPASSQQGTSQWTVTRFLFWMLFIPCLDLVMAFVAFVVIFYCVLLHIAPL